MSDKHVKHKSKYTLDRGIPGAFEGETITRRRFMTGGANAAGAVAAGAFVLPALGFAIGPIFKSTPHRWETVGPESMFSEDNYIPVVLTLTPTIGEAGKTTVYVRKFNAGDRHRPLRPGHALHRDLEPLRAPRLPGALGRRGRALHLPVPRRRLRPARRPVGGPPVRPLDRFYTRVNGEQVEVGPRFSVNSELRRFSPRDPGEPLDGIGQYLYPSRPGAQKL